MIMIVLIGFIVMSVFLLGLWQWAQGGASLWQIWRIRHSLPNRKKELSREEKKQAEREVRELEKAADRRISASFRIVAILGGILWLLFGVSVILGMFGISWTSYIATTARQYWSNPAVQQTSQSNTQQRQNMLRNMGAGLRK